ncbi:MAG: ShlB/FhaC/HecB family hemolysin secretion/activation protein [Candidatus Gastranaerophilales bacterium]|nr:ShlB/FhaC/HecB family hemolysin secretion/activation protein [Candidatus Gastranaerophilales bacterium]
MKIILFKLLLIYFAFFLFGVQGVYSQVIPPSNVDPGAIDRATTDHFRPLEKRIPAKGEGPQINSTGSKSSPEAPATLQASKFQLKNLVFSGSKVIDVSELEKISSGMIGKEVSIEEVLELTKKITGIYKERGYLTSFAYVPPQKIENGVLEIAILEGKVGNIKIQGNKWVKANYIEKNILKNNDFEKQKVFNVNDLRKSLGDINKNEYLKGQVTLQKGVEPETTDIILQIKDRLPIGLSTSWDNTGRELIGVQKANITLSDYNLTGFGDSIYTNVSFASGTFGLGTGYSLPLGDKGTLLNFGYSMANINLGGSYKDYDIKGKSHNFSLGILKPLLKGENYNITSDLSFDMRHSITRMREVELNKSELRVLRVGLNGNKYDAHGRWIARAEVSTGLPLLGGTSESEEGIGSSKFVKLNTNLIRVQALPFKSTGILKLSGQFSPNTLLCPEQMQIGGMYSVRGFDEGLVLGDIGYNASLEVRTPIPFLPQKLNIPLPKHIKSINLKDRIQFATFYDQGFAHAIHQNYSEHYNNFLQGVGVGLRCYLTRYVMANIDFGFPLGRSRTPNQNFARFHFGLSSSLF